MFRSQAAETNCKASNNAISAIRFFIDTIETKNHYTVRIFKVFPDYLISDLMIAETEIVIRLIVATALGIMLGYERETNDKPAGIRTHAIIAVGACLFTLTGVMIAEQAGVVIDTTRIAAGIVTGIGFLGAGAMFQEKDRVFGLTTAAGIWSMGAIGLAVGLGYFVPAIVTTVLVYIVLFSGRFSHKLIK